MTAFRKMHGLGNDFAIFDARNSPLALDALTARAIADRRRGIGCDQLLVIEPSAKADAFMRVFNADGSTAEVSGNGARCAARFLMSGRGLKRVRIDSLGGVLDCVDDGGTVTVDIGRPRRDWREIPMGQAVDTEDFALAVPGFDDAALKHASAVSVGNPHLILFVDDAENAPVERLGPAIERHPWFPSRTNVEFVSVLGPGRLRMRVWERGAGVTEACGSGACAVAVAAATRGIAPRKVEIVLDGGSLVLDWREADDHIMMTGPATFSFAGEVDLAALVNAP